MPRHPHTSPTTQSLSASVYSQLAARARQRPGEIYSLHVGDTYLDPPEVARAESQRSAEHARLHNYAPVQGEPALLDAIVARLRRQTGVDVDRASVQVMCGATSGLAIVCETVLDPDDEVIILSPYWPLIRGIVACRGARPVEVPFFDRLGSTGFDPEAAVEAAVTDRTAALYVNTPNNPTGRVLDGETISALLAVARRHDLWVLCDEAYEDLWLGSAPPERVWTRPDVRDRVIATHTLSKSFGLAGARVGYTHGPPEVMRAVKAVQTYQTYCAPRPLQLGAARALAEGDGWLQDARAAYREAGRRAAGTLGIRAPQGGTFLFFDAKPHMRAGEALFGFLERCLDAGVLLTPGPACGRDYGTWVRLCFTAVPPEDLDRALARLAPILGT